MELGPTVAFQWDRINFLLSIAGSARLGHGMSSLDMASLPFLADVAAIPPSSHAEWQSMYSQ